jgi:hypothetical protein
MDRFLDKLTKRKTKINLKIWGKNDNNTIIQRIIGKQFKNLHSNELENLEANKFTYDPHKLNQEDTNYRNISITVRLKQ